jgi:hypothetical protein
MRRAAPGSPPEASALCQWITPYLDRPPAALDLDIPSCRSPDFSSTKALLSSLKSAVEPRLGTNFCFAELSVDNPSSHQSRLAEQMLDHMELRQVIGAGPRAEHVIRRLGPEPDDAPAYDEEPWLVLTVEHGSDWYNVGAYEIGEEASLTYVEGYIHGPRFGVETRLERVRKELQNITSNLGHIKYMFLYGEQREDSELRGLLVEMLGSELVNDARDDDSVWTSAGYMAEGEHFHMDRYDFENRYASTTAFGCKWRLKLYRAGHNEL